MKCTKEEKPKYAIRAVFSYKDGHINTYMSNRFLYTSSRYIKHQQENVQRMHKTVKPQYGFRRILEVSKQSNTEFGIELSAFNLFLKSGFSVEATYHSAKVFEHGGPFVDIRYMTSMEAKKDLRIKTSGAITFFYYNGISWDVSTNSAFYDYLYIKGLLYNDMVNEVRKYDAFTDIAFNPNKKPLTAACQARSCALSLSDEIVNCVVSDNLVAYTQLHERIVHYAVLERLIFKS